MSDSATAISSPSPLPVMKRVRTAPAVFDDLGVDMGVLDHHGVVEHGHVRHAALAVAGVEIGAEQRILLGRRLGVVHGADQVGIALERRGACCCVGWNSPARMRTDTQARQVSQAGR